MTRKRGSSRLEHSKSATGELQQEAIFVRTAYFTLVMKIELVQT